MPLVEVLPNTKASAAAPGYTYVLETAYDPSKVAINPKDRKRVAQRPGGPRGENELSARQQTAIASRIAELGRDNDMKVHIGVVGKGAAPKTQNARRILQYQRQIKHWLDDEEAFLAQQPPPPSRPADSRGALRRQSVRGTPAEGTPAPSTIAIGNDTAMLEPDDDPLLSVASDMPPPVTQAELDALLSAPPLQFGASFATPPAVGGPPQRRFCDNCGYWGMIKCLKCGTRICGVECKAAHEETRCLKWG